jgi:hypothetical protein
LILRRLESRRSQLVFPKVEDDDASDDNQTARFPVDRPEAKG